MHDIRAIRENPERFDRNWARRGLEKQTPAILRMDEERRAAQTELQVMQAQRNDKSKEIGQIKGKGGDAAALMEEVAGLKARMAEMEEREKTLAEALNQHLAGLPNLLADEVPDGPDESANKEVRKVGEPKRSNAEPKEHFEIGEGLGMMDFETAAKLSGSRFVMLTFGLARLERALAQFMLDLHTEEHGYAEVSPPLLVRDHVLYGTGQLPKFREDHFKAIPDINAKESDIYEDIPFEEVAKGFRQNESGTWEYFLDKIPEQHRLKLATSRWKIILAERDNEIVPKCLRLRPIQSHWLIPTAEVPLTNIVADCIVEGDYLPRRYTAFTPCFRSEAGAAGRDTRGMLRQHQFYKVELVSVVAPDKSEEEHERMTSCAEAVLKKLELPFRTVMLCSGDTGFGARKTYDIEVWLPGQQTYREISSCSNCGDFQARRMKARFKRKGEKNTEFVHTLNGSGVAVGRALIAVMENYYDPADGGVFVPEVLKPYMRGVEKILPVSSNDDGLLKASG